jgi:L-asparaginase
MTSQKPRIGVVGTGGTISSLGQHSLEVLDYPENSRKMEPDEAIERIPEAAQFAELVPLPFRAIGSAKIGPSDWLELGRLVESHASELDGFIILHGTATLEETAYFLHLVLKTDKPVVIVGAQRPASALSTDVGMNVVSAVRTACCPESRGKGVLVVLNDEIHSGRDATKTSTYRLQTFQSRDFGLLGHVDGDGVYFYRAPLRKHTLGSDFRLDGLTELPRVDIVASYAGSDDCAINAYLAAGAKGLVSAGMAPGLSTPWERPTFESAAEKGVVVVQSSRAGSGRVARRTYLKSHNMVGADNLNPQKARVLLMLALTKTADPDQIQTYFNEY